MSKLPKLEVGTLYELNKASKLVLFDVNDSSNKDKWVSFSGLFCVIKTGIPWVYRGEKQINDPLALIVTTTGLVGHVQERYLLNSLVVAAN